MKKQLLQKRIFTMSFRRTTSFMRTTKMMTMIMKIVERFLKEKAKRPPMAKKQNTITSTGQTLTKTIPKSLSYMILL